MSGKAAIYVRCSTQQQSLDVQVTDLKRYAAARGLEVVETFADHGVSGRRDSRPSLDALMKAVRQRRFDYVLVWKLDRLGRNTRHLLGVIDEFQDLGVALVSLSEGFDLSTNVGRAMAGVLAVLAAFEADLIRERVIAGVQAAKERGVRLGRPRLGKEDEIRSLRQQGKTYAQIEKITGVSSATIARALLAPTTISPPNPPSRSLVVTQ